MPVDYYLVTFTLPFELRTLAKAHSPAVLPLLMQCAADTLRRFGRNEPGLEAELGLCAVLHTHTRRLDYHPHVHIAVPGGGVNVARNEWRKLKCRISRNGPTRFPLIGPTLHGLPAEPQATGFTRPFCAKQVSWL